MPLLEQDIAKRKPPPTQADDTGRQTARWAWDGLAIAIPFLVAGPLGYREVITGVRPSLVAGTWTDTRDSAGNVTVTSPGGVGSYLEYADVAAHRRPQTAITVYARYWWHGGGVGGSTVCGKVLVDGSSGKSTWAIYLQDSNGVVLGVVNTTTGEWSTTSPTGVPMPTTAYSNLFLRWATGGSPTVELLADGGAQLGSAATGPAGAGTLSYSTQPMRVNGGEDAAWEHPSGELASVLVWSRRLSDAEIRAIAADPYLPYRRPTVGPGRPFGLPPAWTAGQVMVG